jgi:hypothetical protein
MSNEEPSYTEPRPKYRVKVEQASVWQKLAAEGRGCIAVDLKLEIPVQDLEDGHSHRGAALRALALADDALTLYLSNRRPVKVEKPAEERP